jgi:adenine-specific DNA-methyltransferase
MWPSGCAHLGLQAQGGQAGLGFGRVDATNPNTPRPARAAETFRLHGSSSQADRSPRAELQGPVGQHAVIERSYGASRRTPVARLEELLSAVADLPLRAEIEREVAQLKSRRDYGLVFDHHIPERVALRNLPVRVGSVVQIRTEPKDANTYRVDKISGKRATISIPGSEEATKIALQDLYVVSDFRDPIYPVLTPLATVERGGEKPCHAVINAENYHALQLLRFLFRGAIDVIYIDPPYNSGATDWTYNNSYVDRKDKFRHSLWLSFMDKRLRIAKELLKPNGVLIVTVDENEVIHLGMLLEEIFRNHLRYMVTIVINPKGTFKRNFGRVDEQAFFVVPDRTPDVIVSRAAPSPTPSAAAEDTLLTVDASGHSPDNGTDEDDEEVIDENDDSEGEDETETDVAELERHLLEEGVDLELKVPVGRLSAEDKLEWEDLYLRRRGEESSYRHQRPNQFYAIHVKEALDDKDRRIGTVVGIGPPLGRDDPYEQRREGDVLTIYPVDKEGNERVWRYYRPTMQLYVDKEAIVVGQYNKKLDTYALNHRKLKRSSRRHKTVWWDKSHDAGVHGTNVIKAFLGKPGLFPFPKSVYAVRDCLAAVVRERPNALILDFFAGSGTTLHATALLNEADAGQRRCILVTNNEVGGKVAAKLNKEGIYPGDADYEARGVFEQVTRPRCTAVVSGTLTDGTPVIGRHIDGRPYAAGFPENIEFFRLDYVDPENVELGRAYDAVLPSLWLMSGAQGSRQEGAAGSDWSIPPDGCYAVLFNEAKVRPFLAAVLAQPSVNRVFLVTDSEEAYEEMRQLFAPRIPTLMLYRDFLRSFRVRGGRE